MPMLQKHEYHAITERVPRLKRAIINASGSGDNAVVAAVAGKVLRVYSVVCVSAGTVTTTWKSGVGGSATAITGPMPLVAASGYAPPESRWGHFQTVEGEALNLSLSAAIAVGGWLLYAEI